MTESITLCWNVVVRNWIVYRKDFVANISPSISDPALVLASLGLGLGAYMGEIEGKSYLAFLAPGMVGATALLTAFFEASFGFYVRLNYENIFKAMMTTPIGPKEIILGEFLWNALKGAIMASAVSLFLFAFGLLPHLWLLPAVALVSALTTVPMTAIGLIASATIRNINQFHTIYSFLVAPLYYFSGTFFPLSSMPEPMQWLMQATPFYHGVRLLQLTFWGDGSVAAFAVHGTMLVAFSTALGLWATIKVRKKLLL